MSRIAETTYVTASIEDRDRAGQSWTRKPLMPEAGELSHRAARREGAVGLDEALAFDHRRQVGVVGRVEERR